jgi:hypothetical protein
MIKLTPLLIISFLSGTIIVQLRKIYLPIWGQILLEMVLILNSQALLDSLDAVYKLKTNKIKIIRKKPYKRD